MGEAQNPRLKELVTIALFGMFVLALLPIIWLIVALTALKWEAYTAAFGALVITVVEALLIWQMPALNAATAAIEGFAMALWPICIVIIAAVFTYNLTVHTGAMETIKAMLMSVSSDRRVLVLLIGWCFGGFLEGMAGFGSAIAIPASMLCALGLNPVTAIVACCLANGTPTMFGSVGIPSNTLASLTGLDVTTLSATQTLQVSPFVILSPILMVMLVGGGVKGMKGMWPITLVAGLTFLVPEYITAAFVGADLPVIVGAVCSLVCTFLFGMRMSGREVPEEYQVDALPEGATSFTVGEALRAWSPFILIFVVLLLTSPLVPFIASPLSSVQSTVTFYTGENPGSLTFKWINTPGVLILICGIVGGLIQHASWGEIGSVLWGTCKQMAKTVATMLSVLALAKIMSYSGMIGDISAFFVSALGAMYPLMAPVLGALGTFVTGSGTNSAVLFGQVQLNAANAIGANPYWLAAANMVGVSAGKMLSPQSIAIGSAACDCNGEDSVIFSKVLPYFVVYVLGMMLVCFVGSLFVA